MKIWQTQLFVRNDILRENIHEFMQSRDFQWGGKSVGCRERHVYNFAQPHRNTCILRSSSNNMVEPATPRTQLTLSSTMALLSCDWLAGLEGKHTNGGMCGWMYENWRNYTTNKLITFCLAILYVYKGHQLRTLHFGLYNSIL